eukprot:g7207.t1
MNSESVTHQEAVRELSVLIAKHHWRPKFEHAINEVQQLNISQIAHVTTVEALLNWLDTILTKPPRFITNRPDIYEDACAFHLILNQAPLKSLQNSFTESSKTRTLSPLSEWIVHFMESWGMYLNTIESAKYIQTFKEDPTLEWNDYMKPPSGYLTFNQFFARHVKPGKRPIAGMNDPRVIVSPADSMLIGSWEISENSDIHVEKVLDLKGLKWSIEELLTDSPYSGAFKGGIFSHSFLNVGDYHRFHSPIEGKVLEAKIIKGQIYCDITVVEKMDGERKVHVLEANDETGFQFTQMRGLVIIDSPFGLVACLPIGMSIVSSIVLTVEEGIRLRKGEELGYFQAGGSDFILVFQKKSNVTLSWEKGVKCKQGEHIGASQARFI